MIEGDVYDLLVADGTLTAAVSVIHTGPALPRDVAYPAVLIRRSGSSNNPAASRCEDPTYLATVDVHVWGERGRSLVELEGIADRVFRLLYRAEITGGWLTVGTGPLRQPDDDGYPGYVVQCMAHKWETAI